MVNISRYLAIVDSDLLRRSCFVYGSRIVVI